MQHQAAVDVFVRREGQLVLLYPMTDLGRDWVEKEFPDALFYESGILISSDELEQSYHQDVMPVLRDWAEISVPA